MLYFKYLQNILTEDGKWKNYEWNWDGHNSLDSIVGSIEPVHVHKWGQKE